MKKITFFAVLVISVMLVVSCKSTPGEIRETTDETFSRIYNKYRSGLIFEGAQSYTVVSGDTLSRIANSFYEDGHYYPVIMLASWRDFKSIVADPDKIQPGMELTIIDIKKNMDNPDSRASMRGVILDCADIEESRGRSGTAEGMRTLAKTL